MTSSKNNASSSSPALGIVFALFAVAVIAVMCFFFFRDMSIYASRARWSQIHSKIEPLKLAIAECGQKNGRSFKNCDTISKLTTQTGYATFPASGGVLKNVTITSKTAELVVTSQMSGKNCVVTWTPNFSATNSIAWVGRTRGLECTKEQTGVDESVVVASLKN